MSTLITKSTDIVYPSTDGEPLGESELHYSVIRSITEMLDFWFGKEPLVHLASNLMLYYKEGYTRKVVAPDVQVTLGIPKLPRRETFLLWKEGKAPDFIMEISSKSTAKIDQGTKLKLYQNVLKVQEYFLFDPFGEFLSPPLIGYCLEKGKYRKIEPVNGRLPSQVIGLHFERADENLRSYDPADKKYLPSYFDVLEARAEFERKLHEAEAEAERLRQENEALRKRLPKNQ